MTLSTVSIPYYLAICPYGLQKFKRFAMNVWDVNPEGKTDEEITDEGLKAMESWMRELGVTEDMLPGIVKGALNLDGGYKVLTEYEIMEILKESM